MLHILKTDPAVFQADIDGTKTYEIRFNDRGYSVGDELLLRETTHTGAEIAAGAALEYTGREVTKTVSHVLSGYGLADGWVILSFASPAPAAPASVDDMLPAVRALFAEIFDAPVGQSELETYRDRVIYALTDYVGAVARKAAGEPTRAADEYHLAVSTPAAQPAHEESPLTRYDLYTVTHERRIKPMKDGRYYLASDADQQQAATSAAARGAGRQEVLAQVGALLGIATAEGVEAALAAGTESSRAASSIDTQEFRDVVHAYAAYPADIKPLVAVIEHYKDTAVGRAVQVASKARGGAEPRAYTAGTA